MYISLVLVEDSIYSIEVIIYEEPINAHLINTLLIIGLRHVENTRNADIIPTPIATPAKLINGILDAKYLSPNNIIVLIESKSIMVINCIDI